LAVVHEVGQGWQIVLVQNPDLQAAGSPPVQAVPTSWPTGFFGTPARG
jgi:hypothetical protein